VSKKSEGRVDEPPTRKSHRASSQDWVWDWEEGRLKYQGAQQGWYLPERWSETVSFSEDLENTRGVYVIQARPSGMVKIGYSTDVYRRRDSLQTSNADTLYILMVLDAPRYVERELHRKLSHHRVRGEWFAPECLAEIEGTYPRV
jgi:hypothetical protein